MNCSNCGHQNSEHARFCENCGQGLGAGAQSVRSADPAATLPPGLQYQATETSQAAIWSLICGFVGISCFPIIPSIIAIILGIKAHSDIRRSEGRLGGGGYATAGILLGSFLPGIAFVAMLAAIAVPNFLEAQIRAKESRVQADFRMLDTALEIYYVENNTYPAALDQLQMTGDLIDPFARLTVDPATEGTHKTQYRYQLEESLAVEWIVWSAGPESTYELDGSEFQTDGEFPTPEMIEKTYDPSNGTISPGDIWWASTSIP